MNGENVEYKIQETMSIYNQYYRVTRGTIENKKTTYFVWQQQWKQGQKIIKEKEVEINVKN